MIYRVTKRYGRGAESLFGNFKTIPEAKNFIQTAIEEDRTLKIEAIYSIYEGADLVEECDANKMSSDQSNITNSPESGSRDSSQGQRFSPSPLSTRPQPGGIPRSSWKDESDKSKE